MSEFLATAERLRVVKTAFLEFIQLWAIDQLMETHRGEDRLFAEVLRSEEKSEFGDLYCLYWGGDLDD